MPLDYALALAMLVTPLPDGAKVPHLTSVLPTAQRVALSLELMDPREARFVLRHPTDIETDLCMVQARWAELHDAPALWEHLRFPERALISDLLRFNRTYRSHLEELQYMEVRYFWELHEVLRETDVLYTLWDLARDAGCEHYYVTVRRRALKDLRDRLGEDAFYRGAMPPHVPIWRFERN